MLLKVLTVCLLVAQCFGAPQNAPAAVSGPIDDLIIQILEDFRASLTEPQPIADISFNIDEPQVISLHLNMTELLLHDLSTFVIDNVHVNPLTLKLDLALSLPTISLECNYAFGSGSSIADLFPLYGAGPAVFGAGGMVLTANADLNHNFTDGKDHYQIAALDFFFHFDTLDIQMHNLFNNEDMATVIDEFADDLGPVLVDVIVNETRTDLMPVIIEKLNEILWNATLAEPNVDEEVPIGETLKSMPVELPIQSIPVHREVPHLQSLPEVKLQHQAREAKLNTKRRLNKYQ